MVSICITVYNFSFDKLVKELKNQADTLNIQYEILIGDDSDNAKANLSFNSDKIKYYHNSPSLKRSANRNFLAKQAKYPYLIFIDGDAEVYKSDFLKKYLDEIRKNEIVVCGGTKYTDICKNKNKKLHWKYGKTVEEKTPKERQESNVLSFSSFNFLIKKDVFLSIMFDEKLTSYGHEDTLFGIKLNENNFKVKQIDNPLIHTGIEQNEVFLQKTENAIKNLLYIRDNICPQINNNVRLLIYFNKIKKHKIQYNLLILASNFIVILKKLLLYTSNIKLFSLYKLLYLVKLCKYAKNV